MRFTSPISRCMLACAALLLGLAGPTPAQPQPEQTKPDSAKTAGEVLDEALRKIDAGDLNDAVMLLQRAKRVAPTLDKILLVQGLLNAQAKRFAEATADLEQYNKSDTGKIDYRGYAEVGRVYKLSRLYLLAQRPLEKARELAPEMAGGKPVRAQIALDLASCYFELDKAKKALDAIESAERSAPNDPEIQRVLAEVTLKTKDFAKAMSAIDKSISLLNAKIRTSPFNAEPLRALRTALELKIKIAKTQIQSDPRDANVFYALAEATHELGDVTRRIQTLLARDAALQGAAKDPKLFRLQVYLAFLEADLGGLQEALDRLNDVIANDPQNQAAAKLREEVQATLNKPKAP